MVIDAFMFFNELDLLEIRLNILDEYVDKFVIVEADETFSGKPKPFIFEQNKDRFKKWAYKIIYSKVTDFPLDNEIYQKAILSPNTGNKEHWWVREFYQKESMLKALKPFSDDDFVYISDLDEVWNPGMNLDRTQDITYRPKQVAYHYFLNNRSDQDIGGWVGTRCAKLHIIREYGINHFRTERENPSVLVESGGWHFTYLGNADQIREKIQSFGHQEYNTSYTLSRVDQSVRENTDFLQRGFNLWKDESGLPTYLLHNKEKWGKLFL